MTGQHFFRLLDLPREVIRNICLQIYDPLDLSQQDRLTWGIFSTVDMHPTRQDALLSLVNLGSTCRKLRKEVRVIIFRCIRTPTVQHVEEVIRNRRGWAKLVRSIIIDLSMFDNGNEDETSVAEPSTPVSMYRSRKPDTIRNPRTCWSESALLVQMLNALPSLQHISFFADASDDSTLSLLFASLIEHPSLHKAPPPTEPSSPSAFSTASTQDFQPDPLPPDTHQPTPRMMRSGPLVQPLTSRLRSFGWRQRAAPPEGLRQFSQTSTFVSALHLIRHAHRLSFLVLDADLDEMRSDDILVVAHELALRPPPLGEESEKVSLMLCGPIRGWEDGFLQGLVGCYKGIKELFLDRPLKKQKADHATSVEAFTSLLMPLAELPHLTLLQVGSYLFPPTVQIDIVTFLAREIPSLLVVGLLGEEGETNWWGIWRRASTRRRETWYRSTAASGPTDGDPAHVWTPEVWQHHRQRYDRASDFRLVPLEDGHLRLLEEEADEHRRRRTVASTGPETEIVSSESLQPGLYHHAGSEVGAGGSDVFHEDYNRRTKFRRTESEQEDYRMGSPVDSTHAGMRAGLSRASSAMSLQRMLSE